jgi:hypothetical protein
MMVNLLILGLLFGEMQFTPPENITKWYTITWMHPGFLRTFGHPNVLPG